MACTIQIPVTKTPDVLINRAKTAILGQGGTFEGNATQGSFSVGIAIGRIAANYVVSGNILEITVTKKPFILSCRKIEDFLKKQLNS